MKQESQPIVTKEIIPTDQPPPHLPQTIMLSTALSPIFPHQESCLPFCPETYVGSENTIMPAHMFTDICTGNIS
jgi:hypothetical protein